MTEPARSREHRLRSALGRLWTTGVLIVGLAFGLVILRVLLWPPQASSEPPMSPSGVVAFLGVLLTAYLALCIWHYTIGPILLVLREVPTRESRNAALFVVFRCAFHCGLVLGVPMAIAFAYDLPGIWSALQLLLLWGVYTYLRQYRGPAITEALALIRVRDPA